MRAWLGALVVFAVALAGASCGGGGGGPEAKARPSVCSVVLFVHTEINQPDDVTFVDLVAQDPTTDNQGGPAVLLLNRGKADLGPYEPAITFLIDRYRSWNKRFEPRDAPERTPVVDAAAKRLDEDLAAGLCD